MNTTFPPVLRASTLREAFASRRITPSAVAEEVLSRLRNHPYGEVWTKLEDPARIMERAKALDKRIDDISSLPLYGLPFGVKDNVHVQGMATTCGCPAFSRLPAESATAVRKVMEAGAIFIGKQALDQFATGLNGTRTLGAHCLNVFDPAVIPGGSSSGSGVAVAGGLVSFSLGSDTGGSGRVPAAMNNIVGVRPTVGLVSSQGLVFNNRQFDCIPVFAPSVADAFAVLGVIAGYDAHDPYSRAEYDGLDLYRDLPGTFVFGVPAALEFFGDNESKRCFEQAIDRLVSIGGTPVAFDFGEFSAAGELIFESAWVAERAASYGTVLDESPRDLVPAVAAILERARRYSAVDAFNAQYRLQALKRSVSDRLRGLDVLVTPTVPRAFTVAEMKSEPMSRNAQVGYYTYGVGPLDLCAISVPAAIRADGVPFGLSIVARAGEDWKLRALGGRFESATGLKPGVEAKG